MKKIFLYLTYAGLVPFILCAFFLSYNIPTFPLIGSVEKTLSIYCLLISSFLAGSHWGLHLQIKHKYLSTYLPILSNLIVIAVWFSFMLFDFPNLMKIFVLVFIILLIIDYNLLKIHAIKKNYFHTRCIVSAIVIISLIISGIQS